MVMVVSGTDNLFLYVLKYITRQATQSTQALHDYP